MGGSDGRGRVNLLAMILAPLAAMQILATSRSREFKADAVGEEITGKPLDLAEALGEITLVRGQQRRPLERDAGRPRGLHTALATESRGIRMLHCKNTC